MSQLLIFFDDHLGERIDELSKFYYNIDKKDNWRGEFYNRAKHYPNYGVSTNENDLQNILTKSAVTHSSCLRVLDEYIIYNPYPNEQLQIHLIDSLEKIDGLLKDINKPVLKAKESDYPEMQTLINIYGALAIQQRERRQLATNKQLKITPIDSSTNTVKSDEK